ncbi:hypothetical protein [Sediminicoccus sp. KRV36]|uniref:hypothetical protein n=1 Tax=Sediminicoccus sp. KRV36 TaxID=3133721 RepID=UPI00200E622C|nr:hypothetical protein [Sediminicoccus rosea]UPY37758.1 hypothetical protein LHU95_03425 [Sediminicoccus rosea]
MAMIGNGATAPRGMAWLSALCLGIALCVPAMPAAAQNGYGNGHNNRNHGRGHERWNGNRGYERRQAPPRVYNAPLFGFGVFGPPAVVRPHYAPPPPVYYPPAPRGYYQAPPPAYYGY